MKILRIYNVVTRIYYISLIAPENCQKPQKAMKIRENR